MTLILLSYYGVFLGSLNETQESTVWLLSN